MIMDTGNNHTAFNEIQVEADETPFAGAAGLHPRNYQTSNQG